MSSICRLIYITSRDNVRNARSEENRHEGRTMKITIIEDEGLQDVEVSIRCPAIDEVNREMIREYSAAPPRRSAGRHGRA